MKAFVCALITLAVITAATLCGSIFACHRIEMMLELSYKLPDTTDGADVQELRTLWDDSLIILNLFISHCETDEIDDAIALLESSIEAGDDADYAAYRASLICLLERMKKSESFSLDGILQSSEHPSVLKHEMTAANRMISL